MSNSVTEKIQQIPGGIERNSSGFILIFIAALSAFGPFVTDLYLPALPVMSECFNTSVSMVQMSLTVSLIGLAVGQLFVGPISDKYGRRFPLLASLFIFLLSTLGCVFAWSIESLILFRLIQGFSGAGSIVVSKSIAVDLYAKEELAKFMSLLAAINALAPILAPLVGALLLKYTVWQGIFVTLLVIGLVMFIMNLMFKESLSEEKRQTGSVLRSFVFFGKVFSNKKFLYYSLALAFSMGLFFSYLSASPFIFQTFYKVSALVYGVFFALNALGIMIGTRLARLLPNSETAIKVGSSAMVLMTFLIATLLFIEAPVYLLEASFFFLLISAGVILPEATALALNLERDNAGGASAFIGFSQFLFGGIVSPLVGIGNIMHSTGFMLIICGLFCWVFIRKAIKQETC